MPPGDECQRTESMLDAVGKPVLGPLDRPGRRACRHRPVVARAELALGEPHLDPVLELDPVGGNGDGRPGALAPATKATKPLSRDHLKVALPGAPSPWISTR